MKNSVDNFTHNEFQFIILITQFLSRLIFYISNKKNCRIYAI